MATTSTTLACDVRNYIAEKTLMIAHRSTRFYTLANKAKLPEQHGTTFQYTRYDRLPLPQSTLTEGTHPTSDTLPISVVTAQAQQWGGVVTITDVAELTIAHRPLQKAIELQGYQAAELVEREIEKTLRAGTNVFYHAGVASRSTLASTAINETDIRNVVASLRASGASGLEPAANPFDDPEMGDLFVAVVDPYIEMDIATMTGFVNAVQYADAKRLWNGEAGTWAGVRFIRSNFLPMLTSGASTASYGTVVTAGGSFSSAAGTIAIVLTATDTNTGYERVIYQPASLAQATQTNATQAIDVTAPTTTGFTYNFYVTAKAEGAATTVAEARLALSGLTPGAAGTITAFNSSAALVPALLSSSGSKVHLSYFIGREAFTVVNLEGLRSFLTPASESDSDPLLQRRKTGWRVFFRAVINNNAFMARLEAESAFD